MSTIVRKDGSATLKGTFDEKGDFTTSGEKPGVIGSAQIAEFYDIVESKIGPEDLRNRLQNGTATNAEIQQLLLKLLDAV